MHANPFLLFNWICAWMYCKLLLMIGCRIGSSYGQQYNGLPTFIPRQPPISSYSLTGQHKGLLITQKEALKTSALQNCKGEMIKSSRMISIEGLFLGILSLQGKRNESLPGKKGYLLLWCGWAWPHTPWSLKAKFSNILFLGEDKWKRTLGKSGSGRLEHNA